LNPELKPALELADSNCELALATMEAGASFASSTGYLFEKAGDFGHFVLLLSDLARHTKNLRSNPEVSLLVVETGSEPIQERQRITVKGGAIVVKDEARFEQLKQAYLKVFPRAEVFFELPDFRFYVIEPTEIYWIGGFGKAKVFVPNWVPESKAGREG